MTKEQAFILGVMCGVLLGISVAIYLGERKATRTGPGTIIIIEYDGDGFIFGTEVTKPEGLE